ncbi:MAG: diaminobutyrate--2-oxoglutarate transaminase [Candidatus Carbobacillus altaicus]|nr:diaminobutyrate--2-oxoglutarate transaminase [Candidatus Carbobacillus altaicus]
MIQSVLTDTSRTLGLNVIAEHESEVRAYVRDFPTVFKRAEGCMVWDENGKAYIDFFAGAGALNYGHNHPEMKKAIITYLLDDGIVHSLDLATDAKIDFIKTFDELILKPRNLHYKMMFPGPTGTNAVEAALKLSRKVTGRSTVAAFTHGFHGMTLGALAVTANRRKRRGASRPLEGSISLPYDGFMGEDVDTLDYIERLFADEGSGIDVPAAVIVETVQGEGGLHAARLEWLRGLREITRRHGILLIVDDIQAGSGRTGPFFSFEAAEIEPDMVTLSKSLGGYGLPFALVLLHPDLDQFLPGEHNGTFRGNNLAMVAATTALKQYWKDGAFSEEVLKKGHVLRDRLQVIVDAATVSAQVRGRGMMQGIAFEPHGFAEAVSKEAFVRGLIAETSGPENEVIKLLPPLIIDDETLDDGLERLEDAIQTVAKSF